MIGEVITDQGLLRAASVALATRRSAARHKVAMEELKAEMKTRKALHAQFGDLALWTATWRGKTEYDLPAQAAAEVEKHEAEIKRLKKPHAHKVLEGCYLGQLHLRLPGDLKAGAGEWYAVMECGEAEIDTAVSQRAIFEASDGTLYVRISPR